ncbi:Golgi to ER traffic protein 4 homolog [Anopheles nili]|uniref:Golgi to ER traffic protein 4 homolog n=1 Tax=Anopheles nili TaxID=185578 RepID=UPI00237C2FDD|nr:Golgi to ER traffic protein 4 homolog [Anopheles nili]
MASQEKSLAVKPGSSRGVSRVLAKLEASIESKNFYEAHQMYRTLYFRYLTQGKYLDLLELLYSGSLAMLENEQYSIGADLVLLLIQTLEATVNDIKAPEHWISRLAWLIGIIKPNIVERETVLEKAIKWSGTTVMSPMGHPLMHKLIAQIMHQENNLPLARYHFSLSKDGENCALLTLQLSQQKGFASEVDLFLAQIVLQQLCLKETAAAADTFAVYVRSHPGIACSELPFPMPLLNFLFFLLQLIEMNNRKYAIFRTLVDLYKPSLDRDPSFAKYLHKIGVTFFDGGQQEQPRGFAFSDLIQQFFNDLDVEDLEEGNSVHGSDVD